MSSKKNVSSDTTDHFSLTKRLLKIGGISLEGNENLPFRVYSAFLLSLHAFPFLQWRGVTRYLKTDKDYFEFVLFQAVSLIIFLKFVILLYYRIPLGEVLEKLQTGLLRINVERGGIQEEILVKKYVARTRRQNTIYWIMVTFSTVFALVDSIVWRLTSKELSWRYEYGPFTIFNATYTPNFEVAFLSQNIIWVIMGFMFVVSELLIVAVLAHLTCQLKVLQNSIRRLVYNGYRKMLTDRKIAEMRCDEESDIDASMVSWDYLRPLIDETVQYHLTIIEIAGKTESIFNVLVMLILMSAVVLLGGFLYRFERVHIGGIFCQLGEIYMICYWGNEVSIESKNVMDACFETNFCGADLRFQKSISLIMERSKCPITFTTGKFSTLTLGTFITISRTAYSFLLILQRMT